jgi:hypothetical protein
MLLVSFFSEQLLFLLGAGFCIWMIIDCALNETKTNNKIGWLIVIFFGGPFLIGPLVYLFVRKLPRKKAPPVHAEEPVSKSANGATK